MGPAGRDPVLLATVFLSVVAAAAAAFLAGTRRGRELARGAARTLSRPGRQAGGPRGGRRLVLVGVAGEFAGQQLPLGVEPLTLGRDPATCQLVFPPGTDLVSKRHCQVEADAAASLVLVTDLGSTNGTFLATGERLVPGRPAALAPGEQVYLGDRGMLFEVRGL